MRLLNEVLLMSTRVNIQELVNVIDTIDERKSARIFLPGYHRYRVKFFFERTIDEI